VLSLMSMRRKNVHFIDKTLSDVIRRFLFEINLFLLTKKKQQKKSWQAMVEMCWRKLVETDEGRNHRTHKQNDIVPFIDQQ
jgi:hypothetical protein